MSATTSTSASIDAEQQMKEEASAAVAAAASASASSSSPSSSSPLTLHRLDALPFDNLQLRALPLDKESRNFVREVKGACFSLVSPAPVSNPRLVCVSRDVLRWIELDEREMERPEFVEYFSGNKILPGARPAAHCYCGHQFGHFSGQLGDGATMYLGEIVTSSGERVELQFKGAGPTPYSRRADGRKVLRSSIREFLCSEANHYLGIPTTRAGTIVTSDARVIRDIFYTGDAIQERATIITRLAHSFLRFGSFEIAKGTDPITGRHGPSEGRTDIIKLLLDHVCDTLYQDICGPRGERSDADRYLLFFRELVRRTAFLVAKWQSFGWCHGVLNTDNMSIEGITIDYGPFGYMESFDPEYVCNASDDGGRYRYEAQPEICGWNLVKLSEQLDFAIPRDKLRTEIDKYEDIYHAEYHRLMKRKLGLGAYDGAEEKEPIIPRMGINQPPPPSQTTAASSSPHDSKHEELIDSFLATLAKTGGDFTNSFRALGHLIVDDRDSFDAVWDTLVKQSASIESQVATLAPRIPPQQLAMIMQLMQRDPSIFQQAGEEQMAVIQQEIERAKQRRALQGKSAAAKEAEDKSLWRKWLDSYHAQLHIELESARQRFPHRSPSDLHAQRRRLQHGSNPKYILRNWIAQTIIDACEKGDDRLIQQCLERLKDPFDVEDRGELATHVQRAVSEAAALEETAAHSKPAASEPVQEERARSNLPPRGTQCALHCNKNQGLPIDWTSGKPKWASGLKVT